MDDLFSKLNNRTIHKLIAICCAGNAVAENATYVKTLYEN